MTRFQGVMLLVLPLALAACGGNKSADNKSTASGEILPGSTSDAMLPLDTVRSKAPLAPPTASAADGEDADADADASDAATALSGEEDVAADTVAPPNSVASESKSEEPTD